MATPEPAPAVSILLPTFNRAAFLPAALEAIRTQIHSDWELIVVDDGSADDTEQVVAKAVHGIVQPVTYLRQENAGAYGARNTAIGHARGAYVAFYDSDDIWLPHHLANCVRALEANADVDWVYGACRSVEFASGRVLAPDTFRIEDAQRPFMRMDGAVRGPLHVLRRDGLVECALLSGLYCGLQNSVIRRRVFEGNRFHASLRNEAEDQLFVIRTIKRGHRIGYLDDIHVQYHVHDANSSGSTTAVPDFARQRRLLEPLVQGFEDLWHEVALDASERRALRRRLLREHFWHLGYAVYCANAKYGEALASFRRGLRHWPWSARCWKTYFVTSVRAVLSRA